MYLKIKRIIALLIVLCLVPVFIFPSFAVTSENQATFWEAWLAYLAGSNSHWTLGDGIGTFDILGSFLSHDTVCGSSSDGYHHGTQIDSLVDGRAKVKCSECGEWFYYSASDLEDQYNTSVQENNLDNGLSSSPDGLLRYYLTPASPFYTRTFSSTWSGLSLKPYSFTGTFNSNGYCSFDTTTYYQSIPSSVISLASSLCVDTFSCSGWDRLSFIGSSYTDGSYSIVYPLYNDSNYFYRHTDSSGYFWINYSGAFQGFTPLSFSHSRPYLLLNYLSSVSVPSSVTVNNITYPVLDFDFSKREFHIENNRTIIYDDDKIIIKEGDTVIEENYYYIDDDEDPGPGDDSSSGGGAAGSECGGSACCEQCATLLRQVNQYLLQIQTLVDEINDKLGPDSDNYMEGIYNLLVEINTALDNLPTDPHSDYESTLTLMVNQLSNIWGDLDDIKASLASVDENTALTNDKLDTVHDDLEAVLAELQTQKGILQQILQVLQNILSRVTNIDSNVEELADEESSSDFFNNFILKFHFLGDIFSIIRHLFADITNDAATVTLVDNGTIPIGDLSSRHIPIDGSPVSIGTAPEVLTRFPDASYHGANLSQYSALDLSWYARYKSRVDAILSGFMWIGYLWLLFKRAPGIVRGSAMIEETNYKIDDYKNGG